MNHILSSAALLVAATPAVALAGGASAPPNVEVDPVFAAIDRQATVWDEFSAAYDHAEHLEQCGKAKCSAARPFALVSWRRYSHIGGQEIERARDEFLDAGIPHDVVEREYQQVRKDYLAIVEEQRQWDAVAGVPAGLRQRVDLLRDEWWRLRENMAGTVPTTLAGAAALAAQVAEAIELGADDDWQGVAIQSIAAAALVSVSAARGAGASVSTSSGEHPWIKARRLARELSEALLEIQSDDVAGGSHVACIRPAGEPFSVGFSDLNQWDDTVADFAQASNSDAAVDDRIEALSRAYARGAKNIDARIDHAMIVTDFNDHQGAVVGVNFARSGGRLGKRTKRS